LDGKTPYEAWYGSKPGVKHLRVFGCKTHVKLNGPGVKKLSDRSVQMVFLGYEEGTKGYRVYDPVQKKLHANRDVVFEEEQSWDWSMSSNSSTQPDFYTTQHQFTVHDPTMEGQAQNSAGPNSPDSVHSPSVAGGFQGTAVSEASSSMHQGSETLGPCLVPKFNLQISLCKKKIPITSKCRHMHGVLNVDKI
jgi:hypothetical protein